MNERAEAIKRNTSLLWVARGNTRLRKVAEVAGRGPEYAGPCPRCGGKDRFRVQSEAGRWFCRQCHPEWGDVIEYVEWLRGVGVRACGRYGAWIYNSMEDSIIQGMEAAAWAEA